MWADILELLITVANEISTCVVLGFPTKRVTKFGAVVAK